MLLTLYLLIGVVSLLLLYIANLRDRMNERNKDFVFIRDEYLKLNRLNDEVVAFIEYKKLENESLDFIVERNKGALNLDAIEKYRQVERQIG